MAFEINWLESAQKELDAEIEFVYCEFGETSARNAYSNIMEFVDNLDMFPKLGIECKGYMYRGHEVRALHVKQVTIFYSFDEKSQVTILSVWNNYQDPEKVSEMLGNVS